MPGRGGTIDDGKPGDSRRADGRRPGTAPAAACIGVLRAGIGIGLGVVMVAALAGRPVFPGERLSGPVWAEVVRVIDGDTLEVWAHIWPGQRVRTRVRLAGVDAPELSGDCPRERTLARRARAFVAARIAAPRNGTDKAGTPGVGTATAGVDGRDGAGARAGVWLSDVRFGKYAGRVVARVTSARGEDLARSLIAAGLARAYAGRRRASWCAP